MATSKAKPHNKRVCAACVGEEYLHSEIKKIGKKDTCSYCEKRGKTITMDILADYVDGAFERHYYRTPSGPNDFEYMMYKESDADWERDGEPAQYAIASAAMMDDAIGEDVREILEDRHYDHEEAKVGGEGEFDVESQYEERGPDDAEYQKSWWKFQKSLQTETRLFNRSAQEALGSIFEGLDDHATRDGKKVIVEAGPKKLRTALYRARVFQSDDKLEEAIKRPDRELGPPPQRAASAGRMNARGIAIFYGAAEAHVALAETRPPVGSRVLVGRFKIIRRLRLLDLEALRSISVEGSIFDKNHLPQLQKAKFLGTLSDRMSRPVMPDDEPFDYLVTQAIADYLASRTEPEIDGIIYGSVQNGSGTNVALFHKAARVEALDIPDGTEISASLYESSDEGVLPDYTVWESVPPPAPEKKKKEDDWDDDLFEPPSWRHRSGRPDADEREPALRLDTASLQVHNIERVTFKTDKFKVARHRSEKTEPTRSKGEP
jgi:hypothetical protein